jgi:hypothetical protein
LKEAGLSVIIIVDKEQKERTGFMRILSRILFELQTTLFPFLDKELGPLNDKQRKLVGILELVRIEEHVGGSVYFGRGHPMKDRRAMARAYVAKMVYNLRTTRELIEHPQEGSEFTPDMRMGACKRDTK